MQLLKYPLFSQSQWANSIWSSFCERLWWDVYCNSNMWSAIVSSRWRNFLHSGLQTKVLW